MLLISCYSCFSEFFVQFCIAYFVEFDISEIETDVYRYFKHVQYIEYEAEVKHGSVIDFCAGQDDFSRNTESISYPQKDLEKQAFSFSCT